MGSIEGHLISGGLLIFFGIWHVFNVFLAYLRAVRSPRGHFKSRACWPAPWLPSSLFPFEAVFKIGLVTIWGSVEFYQIAKDRHLYGQQGQHGSMEYLIASTGIVDFFVYFNRHNRWPWLPKKADYAYATFIFVLHRYILANHHPDKAGMHLNLEGFMHMLLTDVANATAAAILAEMIFTNNFWVALLRTYLITLQGTWLWTIGFTIYHGEPLEDRHENYQLLALYFAYTCVVTLVICFIFGILAHASLGFPKAANPSNDDEKTEYNRLTAVSDND